MSRLLPFRSEVTQEPSQESRLLSIDEDAADEVFAALASSTARSILMALYDEPQTASDITDTVDTSLQNTKYHLDKLLDAELIEVVDTWYSEHGREMKVYAPTNGSLVMVASDEPTTHSLREMLERLIGAVGLLGVVSFGVDYVIGILHRRSLTDGSTIIDEQGQVESIGGAVIPPGVLFLLEVYLFYPSFSSGGTGSDSIFEVSELCFEIPVVVQVLFGLNNALNAAGE